MPLLLRTAEQDRATMIDSVMSMALALMAMDQDDDISLHCAYIMLLNAYMGLLRVGMPSRRHVSSLGPFCCSPAHICLRSLLTQLAEALQPCVHMELREHLLRGGLLACFPLPQDRYAVPPPGAWHGRRPAWVR